MKHFAAIKLSTEKFPMQFNNIYNISLDEVRKLNEVQSWEAVKTFLGDRFGEKINSIQIETPLKNDLTYILILRPNKKPFTGILGHYKFI